MKIKTNLLTALMTLSVVFCLVVIPVQAAHPLKATATNTNLLYTYPSSAWAKYGSGEVLKISSGSSLVVPTKTKVMIGTIDAMKVGNGQCVDFVKSVSNAPDRIGAGLWIKGKKVIGGNVPGGTAIAVYGSDNKYQNSLTYSHTAILGNYIASGFNIWDQNWIGYPYYKVVGRHSLYTSDSGRSNANNYYVVEIPDTYVASHFSNIGDKAGVIEPNIVTDGYRNQLEFFRMHSDYFTIQYCAFVATKSWQSYVNEDTNAGTQGLGLAVQAFKIKLVGQSPDTHVYYRAYYNNAWGQWVQDGSQAGIIGTPVKGMQVYIGTGSGSSLYTV